mmetsp:Transcript_39558/g.60445  ORF Transcript_39558/g.60445 Transcript_39558/m.60445 type:complete len:423 (-) Transcript_39558:1026-2294(-)
MTFFFVTHVVGFLACSYREMFSAKTDLFAQVMRIIEIFCIPLHLFNILLSVELLSVILIREHTEKDPTSPGFLQDKCPREDFKKFGGQVFEWMLIEICVYMFFMLTFVILMAKSRFMPVGMDNSEQFEPNYMKLLVNKIVGQIDLEIPSAEEFYVNKERMIQVEGVPVKVLLSKDHFQKLVAKKHVEEQHSKEWVKQCVVGKISKAELDDERMKETNSLDMMQNSSIIYHTESILEMQIACLITVVILTRNWATNQGYGLSNQDFVEPVINLGMTVKSQSNFICVVLLLEHVMSYLFGIFRNYELKKVGQPNKYGIDSAPIESKLRFIEVAIDFLIFALIILHMVSMTSDQMHDVPLLSYWILVDMIIMFLTLPYVYISQLIMLSGEVTKNIFTLYQVQRRKLRERRSQVKQDTEEWKLYFE